MNYLEKAKQIMIQLSEKDNESKKSKEAEEAKKKSEKDDEEKKLSEKSMAKEKKFAEKFGKAFSEHSKGIEDRMCSLEEGLKSVVAMSEKMMADKKEIKE